MARASFIFLLILACTLFAVVPCHCQEDTVYALQGEITSLDWVKGVIVVKWLQTYPTIANDEMTIQVPRDITIMKGTDTVDFDDVNQFDRVTVQYKRQQIGLPKATMITIDNPV